MKAYYTVSLLLFLLFASSCADVAPIEILTDDSPYGFLGGLWHGIIFYFSFIGSLFSDEIAVYAINNSGGWYDFGFLIGLGSSIGGTGVTTSKSK